MNKQWKVGLSMVALAAGILTQAYAADDNMNSNGNMNKSDATAMKSDATGMVNVNIATGDQLMSINLDKKQVDAIMKYRNNHKEGFKNLDELRKVIGDKKFDEIKDKVTVVTVNK